MAQDPEQPSDEGRRLDGRNLIDDWIRDKKKRNIKAEYVWNKGQLDKVDTNNVDYLLGDYQKITAGQHNRRNVITNVAKTLLVFNNCPIIFENLLKLWHHIIRI